ncbi:ATP-binding cassette domain-containing protein [Arthrobacter sp. BL-252-APC-1A]|uniref:ABC transporter ATP-binding protein n=1 Tax=Arthrobacter sp. BL-252-APC-1A TaxID=2606622 RepID=UPI0012B2DC70|nr:ATP-binding cassette domain-containing protein [Arthrobacter sp. BL-252-APC-1A]MSS00317.1 ATP-binding cassette domain-containing protein [Arthrobacter sp. BL-252-APC-1A]
MNAAIEVKALSKRFGAVVALEDVTVTVEYGRVVGFLGPNGAGKSTLMRALLGLIRSDSGEAHIAGAPYARLPAPAKTVGAVLDIASAHPRVTARAHLHTYAALGGMDRSRVDTVLSLVGAPSYADRRVGTFSTGMRQRLALATAMLGDPDILVLDEPSNGLDPSGIAWLRTFLREFADAGGAVLLSSHVLHEIEHTIDDVILIDRGRTVWTGALERLVAQDAPLEKAFLRLTQKGPLS